MLRRSEDDKVLNAFRHHGLFRTPDANRIALSILSSAQRLSASRIISAASCCTVLMSAPGAQRLSASRIISDKVQRQGGDHLLLCSTPFGITDYFGGRGNWCARSAPRCAQRLSASRIISASIAASTIANAYSAQRLSASRIISVVAAVYPDPLPLQVLNAFRHHGLFRIGHVARMLHVPIQCSTPFGITDYFGIRNDATIAPSTAGAQRLSASRIISVASFALSFSTNSGAQRLSASRIISGAAAPRPVMTPLECSTPFGITDYFGRARQRSRW